MFVIHEDMTIYATRGDVVYFVAEKQVGEEKYQFQPGDVVRIKIFEKKNPENVVMMKDFLVEEECTGVNIFLDRFDTKFGGIIAKPVDYWYEVELNPDTLPDTFIGYNEDGPKVFRLFPEGKDVIEGEIEDPEENAAVTHMVVTFVNEYMGENAETMIQETFDKYVAEHPPTRGEDGIGIESATVDASGYLMLTYSDGSEANVGHVVGSDGKDGKNGVNGVTFTPSVDADGNLSWTNFGGLENPATVNIRGPVGPAGANGHTPVKGTDYYTDADKDEMEEAVLEHFGMPQMITFTKDGSYINAIVTEADGSVVTDKILLDSDGRPAGVTRGDKTCGIVWGNDF